MIIEEMQIRPRYDEVDQMGYVYHANYVCYCHMARTELLRKFGINDKALEDNNIILPVISMDLKYFNPAYYDEELTITTTVNELPVVRFHFDFDIRNRKQEKICKAHSTIVFADKITRRAMKVPELIEDKLTHKFQEVHT